MSFPWFRKATTFGYLPLLALGFLPRVYSVSPETHGAESTSQPTRIWGTWNNAASVLGVEWNLVGIACMTNQLVTLEWVADDVSTMILSCQCAEILTLYDEIRRRRPTLAKVLQKDGTPIIPTIPFLNRQ